jgi:DNA-binding transcriptional regulator GbsR (MarR family)
MSEINAAREHTIQGLSRISQFWGFSRGMGAIYGAVYLSPTPLSLDDLVEQAQITKGAVSTNVRQLERLGLVHRQVVIGERKDYYSAETDFWKIIQGILQEREMPEFDRALRTVFESIAMLPPPDGLSSEPDDLANFYRKRLKNLADFFKTLDKLVAALLALEDLRLASLEKWIRQERSG